MGEHLSALVLWLAFAALGIYVLYVVIRKGVRDGMRDASRVGLTRSRTLHADDPDFMR